jgi:hypothetical protein
MSIPIVLGALAVSFAIWNIVTTIRVYDALHRRGVKASLLWLRVLIPWYVERYKRITLQESGRIGLLYYHWIISINLTLVAGIAAVATALL